MAGPAAKNREWVIWRRAKEHDQLKIQCECMACQRICSCRRPASAGIVDVIQSPKSVSDAHKCSGCRNSRQYRCEWFACDASSCALDRCHWRNYSIVDHGFICDRSSGSRVKNRSHLQTTFQRNCGFIRSVIHSERNLKSKKTLWSFLLFASWDNYICTAIYMACGMISSVIMNAFT